MPETRHSQSAPEQAHLLSHNEHTPMHHHRRGHLVYPASGVLSLVTEAGSWIAPPNRTVWIPGASDHRHRSHGATDMRIVFLPTAWARELPVSPAVLGVSPLARQALLRLTDDAERSEDARDRLRGVIIDELGAAPEQPLHLPDPADERLRAATRLVERDLANPLSLAEIGREIGASERSLSRLFALETGMSFRQWRTQLRVHRALLMLAEGRSVLDTATACGWANPSAFIGAFTSLVGETPGLYQRSLRES